MGDAQPFPHSTPADVLRTLDETLEGAERAHIQKGLEAVGWRVSGTGGAAERLGLKPPTLEYRITKLGIAAPAERPEAMKKSSRAHLSQSEGRSPSAGAQEPECLFKNTRYV
ncbi:MAG: helix-turn-helix domain-containing protein [bacterium]